MMDAARKALEQAKAKEQEMKAKLEGELAEKKEQAEVLKEQAKVKEQELKVKLDSGLQETREKAQQVKEQAKEKTQQAVSKVRREITPPRTEKVSGMIFDSIYVICHGCDARLGPMKQNKFNTFFSRLGGAAKTSVGTMMGRPRLVVEGLAQSKEGLISSVTPGDGSKKEVKAKAKKWLDQCDKCGKWNCPDCFHETAGLCTKCQA